jgi:hypothetical protein
MTSNPQSEVRIPAHIWEQLRDQIPKGFHSLVVHLKLRGGRYVMWMVADVKGQVVGELVGGHDGISSAPLDFTSEEIVAVRQAQGILGWLGLTQWVT